jgi:hypothetical protein
LSHSTADSANTEQVDPATDPNFLSGPAGFGTGGFVTGNTALPYYIGFSNETGPVAPAQQVTVTQQLDPNLDLSTFQLGSFGFGNIKVDVPAGRQVYSTRVDVRSTLGIYVDISAALDIATRTVTWTFKSIDPQTGTSRPIRSSASCPRTTRRPRARASSPIPSARRAALLRARRSMPRQASCSTPTLR